MEESRGRTRWKCLKSRLSLFSCCTTPTAVDPRPTTITTVVAATDHPLETLHSMTDLGCLLGLNPDDVPEEMNLATALAAERQYRGESEEMETDGPESALGTPMRVSLMRLLVEGEEVTEGEEAGGGASNWCCVCMGRRMGAAFIPCGHTFCRVCVRELWLNRGSCPLCNRPILEILDIF